MRPLRLFVSVTHRRARIEPHHGSLDVVETIRPSSHANSHAGSCASISKFDLSNFSIELLLQRARTSYHFSVRTRRRPPRIDGKKLQVMNQDPMVPRFHLIILSEPSRDPRLGVQKLARLLLYRTLWLIAWLLAPAFHCSNGFCSGRPCWSCAT